MPTQASRPPVGALEASGVPGVVDVHAHLFPQSAVASERAGREWFGSTFDQVGNDVPPRVWTNGRCIDFGSAVHRETPLARLSRMDALGISRQVISLLPPLFRYELSTEVAVAAARSVNDEIAAMVREHPDRFSGLATLPLQDVDASLKEFQRSLALGLSGFAIGTHVAGVDLDDPRLRPIFLAASRARAFVLCHPVNPRAGACLGGHYLSNIVGNPLETTLAFTRLVLGGVLDEAPDMNLCLVHGGGYVATACGRLDHAYRVRPESRGSRRTPSHYLQSLYVDTLTHDTRTLRDLVDRFGMERVLLGSDYPADMGSQDPVGFLNSADLSADERQAIASGNAMRLLSLPGWPTV